MNRPQHQWQNRIVGTGTRPASDFLAHSENWRIHPKNQQDALKGVLDSVGWVQNVVVSARTGKMLDGHLRVTLALRQGEETPVPYVEVDVTEDEERLILATLDPIAALAGIDKEKLAPLLGSLDVPTPAVADMLEELARQGGLESAFEAPEPTDMKEPETPAECFIEIYCAKDDLEDFRPVLAEWGRRVGVTVNIS
jgi:hypothetical protein